MRDQINDFFADLDVQRLVQLSARDQPLQICFPREVNVSRMLAWLLDPSEGHGLGDSALRSLLARAGQLASGNASLPQSIRRFLSPSNIYTSGFSGAVVTTEVKVDPTGKFKHSLDVFCVDQGAGLYVAIENKFGAKQSEGQLEKYRVGLEELFPEWTGIHIFLDSRDKSPDDDQWIQIGYDWLAEFLRESELKASVSLEVRRTLGEFRLAIHEQDEEEAASTPMEHLAGMVAARHPDVLAELKGMAGAKGFMARELSQMMVVQKGSKSTLLDAARLRLFLLYWRRPQVWERCIQLMAFAPFLNKVRAQWTDILVDTKRVKTYLSLPEWECFVEPEDDGKWNFPLVVAVRESGDTFMVTSYCWFSHVKAAWRQPILSRAKELRKGNFANTGVESPNFLAIRRQSGLTQAQAIVATMEHMRILQDGFKDLVRS